MSLVTKLNNLISRIAADVKRLDNRIKEIPFSNAGNSNYFWIRRYVGTAGNTLIPNYNGIWGNNFNFSNFSLTHDDVPPYCYSAWSYSRTGREFMLDNHIYIDFELEYPLHFWTNFSSISSILSADANLICGAVCYDADGKEVREYMGNKITITVEETATPASKTLKLSQDSYNKFKQFHQENNKVKYYYFNTHRYVTTSGLIHEGTYSPDNYGSTGYVQIAFNDATRTITNINLKKEIPVGSKVSVGIREQTLYGDNPVFKLSGETVEHRLTRDYKKVSTLIKPKEHLPRGTATIRLFFLTKNYSGFDGSGIITRISQPTLRIKV